MQPKITLSIFARAVRTNVDPTLIADQRNFKAKYLRGKLN